MESIICETERLNIRRFSPDDWPELFEYLSVEDVVRFEPYDIFTEEQAKQEALDRSSDPDFWAVCLKKTGKLIGNIYLSKRDFDTWELGYVFNNKYWGCGYAAEAARFLAEQIFTNYSAHRITAMCDPRNEASWKLLERIGMRREGHLINNIYFKVDQNNCPIWKDTYEYAILREEWRS